MSNIKEILDGFNAGYILEKHSPELSKQLGEAVSEVEDEFFHSFIEGREEYAKERTQSKTIAKLKEASKGIPRPTKSKDRDDKEKGFEIDI